jgi:hypothetical protein
MGRVGCTQLGMPESFSAIDKRTAAIRHQTPVRCRAHRLFNMSRFSGHEGRVFQTVQDSGRVKVLKPKRLGGMDGLGTSSCEIAKQEIVANAADGFLLSRFVSNPSKPPNPPK